MTDVLAHRNTPEDLAMRILERLGHILDTDDLTYLMGEIVYDRLSLQRELAAMLRARANEDAKGSPGIANVFGLELAANLVENFGKEGT